jgi:IS605 OrfB family transposase
MKQILTYITKLKFSNQDDKDKIISFLKLERDAFNFCSTKCFNIVKNSIVLLHSLYYKEAKIKFPNAKSQLLIKAENNCLSAYKSIKSNKHKINKPIVKKGLSTHFDKRLYRYKDNILYLTTENKRVACTFTLYNKLNNCLNKYKFCDPLIWSNGTDIFASLSFYIDIPEINNNKYVLGIDLGIRRIASTSEGNIYIDKKYNAQKRKIRHLKRVLNSKKIKTAKKHLKKIKHKEQNITKNMCHNLVNSILKTSAGIIAIEDLDVKKLKSKKNKYQNKNRISQIPFSLLRFILTYKAGLVGKQVVCVNPSYTSQIDCVTDQKLGIRKGCRFYAKSGLIYDADINAAVNIAKRTKRPVSYKNILDGQAVVNQLNTQFI